MVSSNLDDITNKELQLPRPTMGHPRCDACRYIGILIDSNLRSADERLYENEELSLEEVEAIAEDICSKQNFGRLNLVNWENELRLSLPHLETWNQGVSVYS